MNVVAPSGVSPTRSDLYSSEVRFGVVMYGGVSLAIYINGVANEMYEMACATPKVVPEDVGAGTRGVYHKASLLLGNEDLRTRYKAHLGPGNIPDPFDAAASLATSPRVRFVIDVISGTSAGGINGAFLAKALANGQEFSPLKNLWIQEGNIESLLNDEASYEGLEYAKDGSPTRSLLNSDRMYIKLLEAFQDMATVMPPIGVSESPLVDEIDLYMTTTDIRGSVVPLRLFDEVVYEKRFRQVYHFQYAAANGKAAVPNDLANKNAPFLAFAARCTSSFPFAFEPMTVNDAIRLCEANPIGGVVDFDPWKPLFTGLSSEDMATGRWRSRAFGDGGYLDNKPFSYVVEALSWRLGGLPMDRKLIYVEPAPTHPETEREVCADKPDAIQNAFAALNTIPRYETIREDLEAVLVRNRRIERVERIVRQVEADIELRDVDPFKRIKLIDGKVPDWSSLDMGQMIDYYGVAFLPYRRLRMTTVNDDIADRLAVWWDIDRDSDRFYALKAMVRVWREQNYYENKREQTPSQTESINAFLDSYDVKYRLRRVSFLLRKVHELLSLFAKLKQGEDKASPFSDIEKRLLTRLDRRKPSLSEMDHGNTIAALNVLAEGFGQGLQELRGAVWALAPLDEVAAKSRADLHETLERLLSVLLGDNVDPPFTVLYTPDGKPVEVKTLPPPSRLRTLQENVFERAKFLFGLAKGASTTKIQEQLEADLKTLRAGYDKVIRSPTESKTPLARELLGNPKLVPSPDATTENGIQYGVVTHLEERVGYCGGVLDSPEGKILREFLANYYMRFDEYDQMSFPLYYDTGTGEPSIVEVLRVSPEDARGLIDERADRGDAGRQRRKLAGTALFNFGAFLDVRWRRNDIMWGRLDGCERLLAALFPEDDDIRNDLLQEAQRIILREEMQPDGYALLVDRFAKALAEQKESTLKEAFEALWKDLPIADDQRRSTQTALALKAVLGDAGLLEYVRRYYEVNRTLDSAATAKTAARALTITGRILEESEKDYRLQGCHMVWVTRGGRALQALLTVSTPGALPHAILRHWLVLLYLFEMLIVAGAVLFSSAEVRTFGLTCLGLTLALNLASLVAGDLMYRRWGWVKSLAFVLAIAVLLLACLGGWDLYEKIQAVCTSGGELRWFTQMLCLRR
jgi:patatin-related protein